MEAVSIKTAEVSGDLVKNARALVPELRARSLEIAKARQVPDEVMSMLKEAGLMQIARPARFGGRDLGMDLVFLIGRILAEGDGSTAWVYVVGGSHDHLVGLYPLEVQERYWASSQPLCASSYQPTGKAEKVDGGYVLSGQWSFCSGIDHCGWIVVGAITGMIPGDRPAPDLHLFMIPKSDLELVDDWHVMGLAGTGSKSVVADQLFVPDNYVLRNLDVQNGNTPGRALHDNPLYGASIWPLFGFSILAATTGIVRGAYESLVADFKGRVEAKDPMFEGRRPAVQMRLAEVSALLESSELLYNRGLKETYSLIMAGQPLSEELRVRNRRDQVFLARQCREAMENMMAMAGGRGIREEGLVQRAMRDVYAISAHPGGNWDAASSSFGSVLLGGSPTEMFC